MTNKEHIEQTISFLELHRLNAEEQKLRRQAEYPVLLEEARLAKERASDCHQQETRCEYLARDYETAIAILRGLLNEDS